VRRRIYRVSRVWSRRTSPTVLAASVVLVAFVASASALRPPTAIEKRQIAAEVRLTLSALADSPDSGVAHGLHIVLAPVCISTSDPRYAAAVGNPIQPSGRVGQAATVYMHRVHGGYRVLGGLRVGDQLDVRPSAIPKQAWDDLHKQCSFLGAQAVKKLRAGHKAPEFTI